MDIILKFILIFFIKIHIAWGGVNLKPPLEESNTYAKDKKKLSTEGNPNSKIVRVNGYRYKLHILNDLGIFIPSKGPFQNSDEMFCSTHLRQIDKIFVIRDDDKNLSRDQFLFLRLKCKDKLGKNIPSPREDGSIKTYDHRNAYSWYSILKYLMDKK